LEKPVANPEWLTELFNLTSGYPQAFWNRKNGAGAAAKPESSAALG